MTINNRFNLDQIVYLKTDPEQAPRMVTRISIGPNDHYYKLNRGTESTWHSEFEIIDKPGSSFTIKGFSHE